MRKTNWKWGSALTFAVASAAGIGAADTASAQQAAAEARNEDTVIVTATRREQALQDTPIAITAIGQEQIAQQNVVSTQDLQRVAPTLVISSSNSETGGSTIRIRGVGTTGNNAGLEGAVGVFIDGVYRQRAGLALNNLFDLQRVEVLRGPQGTLFGKNTSAGAISIVPNAPELGEFGASVKLGVGNFNDREFEGMINIPLGDTLAARVSGTIQQRDGYVEDKRSGADSFNRDRQLVRGMLLWEPNDNISWRGTVDYSKKDEDCCQAVYSTIGGASLVQASVGGTTIPTDKTQRISVNSPTRPFIEQTKDLGFSSHLTIDFGDLTFKNIIAHRRFESQNDVDADFGPADILYQKIANVQELTSFEATLNGNWGILDWLVGGYYSDETVDQTNNTPYGTQLGTYVNAITATFPASLGGVTIGGPIPASRYPVDGGAVAADFNQDGTSWSVFTHNQFQFTDRLGGVLGVRYNNEKKDGGMSRYVTNSPSCSANTVITPAQIAGAATALQPTLATIRATLNALRLLCPRPTYQSTIDEGETTGIAGLNYKFTDNIFGYLSYSRGYKAGGINLDRDAPAATGLDPNTNLVLGTQAQINAVAAFKPEFSDSYEVGVRTQFFDRTLTLNTTYFKTDYTDFQLNTFNGLGFSITNPGSVESHGFEVEGAWKAGEDLDFTFGVAQTIAKYGDEAGLRAAVAATAAPPFPANPPLASRTLTNAPKWSLSGGVHYEHTMFSDIKGFFDISASYRTTYNTGSNLNPTKVQPAFTLVNGRIGLFQDSAHGWEVAAFGNNLFDEYYSSISFDTTFQSGSISDFPGAPRMYGVTVKKTF